MKYMLALLITITSLNSHAGFYDSDYFEPTLMCGLVGAVGYSSASDGDEATQGAIGCAVGSVLGVIINKYYKKKVYLVHENKINDLKAEINIRITRQAEKAYHGDTDEFFSLEAQQIIKSQELPGGEILSPTKRIILKAP